MKSSILALAAASAALVFAGCSGKDTDAVVAADEPALVVIHREGLPTIRRLATPEEAVEIEVSIASGLAEHASAGNSAGDYGQVQSGLTGIQVWGQHGTPLGDENVYGHQDYCGFPNAGDDKCGIPLDKIIRYRWTGATSTSEPQFAGINFASLLTTARSNVAAAASNWSIGTSNSSDETMLLGSDATPNMCSGGVCAFAITATGYAGSGQCANDQGVQHCYRWQNQCKTTLNVSALARALVGLSTTEKQRRLVRLMSHEMGHCMGFQDFELAENFTGDQLMWWSSPPWTPQIFGVNEQNSLLFFQPGH